MLSIFVWTVFDTAAVSACPLCKTETGKEVRAGIVDEHFGRTLAAVAAPFPILLGVVAMIHFGWPMSRRDRIREEDE
jgi:hypothetical protein